MISMHAYKCQSFILIAIGLLYNCTNAINDNHTLNLKDTTVLVQTVLSDGLLESEIIKDFGNQQFKLIEGPAVKLKQEFMFAGRAVSIVPSTGDTYQIHQQHPKELYVSVPKVIFFSKDSAAVSLIFHAGNATAFFNLKNEKGRWQIKGRQYGKF